MIGLNLLDSLRPDQVVLVFSAHCDDAEWAEGLTARKLVVY